MIVDDVYSAMALTQQLEVVQSTPPPSPAPYDEFLHHLNLLHLFIAEDLLHHSDQHLVVAGSQDQDTSNLALRPVWSAMSVV